MFSLCFLMYVVGKVFRLPGSLIIVFPLHQHSAHTRKSAARLSPPGDFSFLRIVHRWLISKDIFFSKCNKPAIVKSLKKISLCFLLLSLKYKCTVRAASFLRVAALVGRSAHSFIHSESPMGPAVVQALGNRSKPQFPSKEKKMYRIC